MMRNILLRCFGLLLFACRLAPLFAQTGKEVPELAGFDRAMKAVMDRYSIPGAALAVTKNGRLVFARGYGYADRDLKTPAQPDSSFRIGSISKPITAMTTLKLVQEGKLHLDDLIVPLLGRQVLPPEVIADGRWNQITIRDLLRHSGGWDAGATFDPITSYAVVEGLGLALPLREPLTIDQVIRFMASKPLQFNPGTQYSYSNFGFVMLGRILERVSGMAYEKLVKQTVMEPMGIEQVALGGMPRSQRKLGEVEYYDTPDAALYPAVYPGIGEFVTAPDGGFYFEIVQAAGRWIASPIELVRFINGLDGLTGSALLQPSLIREMTAAPPFNNAESAYGLGWILGSSLPGGVEWGHNGEINGTYALLFRAKDGVALAVTFNTAPDLNGSNLDFESCQVVSLLRAIRSVRQWPSSDAFGEYLPPFRPRISGIVEAAGNTSAAIAPGGLVTLYGTNLGRSCPLGARKEACRCAGAL
jgi:CubicO group peptidase (beta-lactamase class C family)